MGMISIFTSRVVRIKWLSICKRLENIAWHIANIIEVILFYFIFLLYNTVLVLPYMNPPQVYMSSQPWTPLPPPSPYHLSGSSQCTSPKHPISCIEVWERKRQRTAVEKWFFPFYHTVRIYTLCKRQSVSDYNTALLFSWYCKKFLHQVLTYFESKEYIMRTSWIFLMSISKQVIRWGKNHKNMFFY